jgi:flagellar motility protein MotE (MotC chaperone)
MTRTLRDFRIIPVALIAITALFVLKSFGLILNGSYTLPDLARNIDDGDITGTIPQPSEGAPAAPAAAEPVPLPPRERSWAQQVFNFPGGSDVTGSVGATKQEPSAKDAKPKAKTKGAPPASAGIQVPVDGGRLQSPAERAVLERLAERRQELEARAKELEMRESLVLAAEKRLESRLAQLKQLEAQITEAVRAKDENEAARLKQVVVMYENMKPKDAARVFDRLDLRVLVDVATKINSRRMADILAQMSPEVAERLTIELASRAKDKPPAELPKIEGRPTGN